MKTEDQIKAAIHWIEKLATAEKDGIKQGERILGSATKGYCCLGYGCVVSGLSFYVKASFSESLRKTVGLLTDEGMSFRPSKEGVFFNMFGRPVNLMRKHDFCLPYLNDEKGYSFKKISKRLQKYPNQYFLPEVAKGIKEHFAGASA